MKKIPRDAEASNVLVGEVDFLDKPFVAFVRLAQATTLGGLTEVPVPTRYSYYQCLSKSHFPPSTIFTPHTNIRRTYQVPHLPCSKFPVPMKYIYHSVQTFSPIKSHIYHCIDGGYWGLSLE